MLLLKSCQLGLNVSRGDTSQRAGNSALLGDLVLREEGLLGLSLGIFLFVSRSLCPSTQSPRRFRRSTLSMASAEASTSSRLIHRAILGDLLLREELLEGRGLGSRFCGGSPFGGLGEISLQGLELLLQFFVGVPQARRGLLIPSNPGSRNQSLSDIYLSPFFVFLDVTRRIPKGGCACCDYRTYYYSVGPVDPRGGL